MNIQILILNDDMDTMKEMKSILSKINMLSKHTLDLYRDVWIAEFPDLTYGPCFNRPGDPPCSRLHPGFPIMTSYWSSVAWTPCRWCGAMLCSASWAGDLVGKEDEVKDRGDTAWKINKPTQSWELWFRWFFLCKWARFKGSINIWLFEGKCMPQLCNNSVLNI